MKGPDEEKSYSSYMVNRGLSYFEDSVLYANEMNQRPTADSRMQFDFLRLSLSKRKRMSKWFKAEADDKVASVAFYYKTSEREARMNMRCMTEEDVNEIHAQVSRLRSAQG
jgi:hypothetical protein